MSEILMKEESYELIGVCMEVHNELGMGFKEEVYKEAIEIEFRERGIPFKREVSFNIEYKGKQLKRKYPADFVVFDSIILEAKAATKIVGPFIAQTINYLKASGIKLGIIVNFGEPTLKYKRVVF